MRVIDRQADIYIYGEHQKRSVYTDGEKLYVKWYGELVEVVRRAISYVSAVKGY